MNELVKFPTIFDLLDDIFEKECFDFDIRDSERFYHKSFPPTDVSIYKEMNLKLELAVAGYVEEDINLSFDGDILKLDISKVTDENKDDVKYISRGIKKSSLQTTYVIPATKYNTDAATAKLKNGILTIDIPVNEKAKPKKLSITKANN